MDFLVVSLILISLRLVAVVSAIMILILNASSVKLLGNHFLLINPPLIELI